MGPLRDHVQHFKNVHAIKHCPKLTLLLNDVINTRHVKSCEATKQLLKPSLVQRSHTIFSQTSCHKNHMQKEKIIIKM